MDLHLTTLANRSSWRLQQKQEQEHHTDCCEHVQVLTKCSEFFRLSFWQVGSLFIYYPKGLIHTPSFIHKATKKSKHFMELPIRQVVLVIQSDTHRNSTFNDLKAGWSNGVKIFPGEKNHRKINNKKNDNCVNYLTVHDCTVE